MQTQQLITNARRSSGLGLENFATLTHLSRDRLQLIEAAQAQPTTEELNNVARALGAELSSFLQGEPGAGALFFRAMREDISLDDLLLGEDGLILGDFLRCVGRVTALRAALGEALPAPGWLEEVAPAPLREDVPPYEQGVQLATQARAYFGLGDAPVPSMSALLTAHGVEVFSLTPGRLQAYIDGACTLQPAPAVLINPLYEGAPWSHRATMAHELCHLLYDRGESRSPFLLSPVSAARRGAGGERRWGLFDGYLRMEQRANAFAAHFLAPGAVVRALLSGQPFSPASGQAAQLICATFGVGHETAVNLLWRTFGLSEPTRRQLLSLPREGAAPFPYQEQPDARGLFTGQLQELALRAYAQGLLSRVEVRRHLEITMDAPLPQGRAITLTEAQRAPLLTAQARAMRHALWHLTSLDDPRQLYLTTIDPTQDGWEVTVMEEPLEGEPVCVGLLQLSHDYTLRSASLSPAP
jgi:Zn-dependent peptidase ImmA (M78 family)/transcriptional regulator with XRE-family HTH domain